VDRGAAILLADAAETAGVGRYLLLSAMGTDLRVVDDDGLDPVFRTYLRAKLAAENAIRSRTALQAMIVRSTTPPAPAGSRPPSRPARAPSPGPVSPPSCWRCSTNRV
jgi:nucleoside-diphosphate-sugar epimerase